MNISEVIQTLEAFAPLPYQENYDNAGLLTGSSNWNCTGILCTLDATEVVVNEAVAKIATSLSHTIQSFLVD